MKDSDKRLIVEKVGLCWHEWGETPKNILLWECIKCSETVKWNGQYQLDPLDPADMYGKIWVAFVKMEAKCRKFLDWLNPEMGAGGYLMFKDCQVDVQYLNASDLAQAMLEYFNEKEGKDEELPTHRSRHNYQNGCTCGQIFEFVKDLEEHLKEAK